MIDGQDLRAGMRTVPTAVTVVTTAANGKTRGATIGSFASVSLDPPLVCFNISRDAQLHSVLAEATRLAVHVLRDDQTELSNFFANKDRSSEEQLQGTPHAFDEHGVPIIDDVLVVFCCEMISMSEAGDSSLVVARVDSVQPGTGGDPLVFYDRGYFTVGDRL